MQTRRSLIGSMAGVSAISVLTGSSWATARTHIHVSKGKSGPVSEGDSPPAYMGDGMTPMGPFATSARWAYVLNSSTGSVLLDKASNERMPPSSLTKMMTAYVVFAFLAAGRIRLDQTFLVSDRAWKMQGSRMFVPLGSTVSVNDLIRGMLIQSGNDACVVLAEGIAGSEERFVTLMNEAAGRLGLEGSHFVNVTGLPDPDHYMTAHDVGVVAHRLIRDFPQYYAFFGEKEFTFNHIHQGNRNVLVDKGIADGLKTGHTDAGGFGLCASSERNGTRIIVVINGTDSMNERAHEGERLMSWAFANFETITVLQRDQVLEASAAVWMGEKHSVTLRARQDVILTIPIGWRSRIQVSVDYPSPLTAPVVAGSDCGTVSISFPGQVPIQYPLYIGESVGKLGFVGRIMTRLGHAPA